LPLARLHSAKLTPPRLEGVLVRQRLFEALERARARPIVWITAPPGAGKTTLVGSYLQACKSPALRYQVDEGDGDPAGFFHYLGLATRQALPRIRRPLPAYTPDHAVALQAFTRTFFRDLYGRFRPPFNLVFDNFQEAPDQSQFHEVLVTGLLEVPPGGCVFVLSRMEPPAAFARLRASSLIAEFDREDLKLNTQEVVDFIDLRLPDAPHRPRAEELVEETAGWAAGIVLLIEQ